MGEVSYISVDNNPPPPSPAPLHSRAEQFVGESMSHVCRRWSTAGTARVYTRGSVGPFVGRGPAFRMCAPVRPPFHVERTDRLQSPFGRDGSSAVLSVMRNDRPFEYTHREKKTLKHRTNIACNMEHASTEMDRIKGAHILYA